MALRTVVRRLFASGNQPLVMFECRLCGTTLDAETETCPECGTAEISRYEIY